MASIITLPPETITTILKHLNPFDLESVARTFSSRLYYPAINLLVPLQEWIRNARAMCKLFDPKGSRGVLPSYPGQLPVLGDSHLVRDEISRRDCKGLGLDPEGGPYCRHSPPDLQSWMKLDGSFDWLQSLQDEIADEMEPHIGREGGRPVAPKRNIDRLVSDADKHGLKLPIGFESFLRSDRLHHRVPSFSAWYFSLSKLIKSPPVVDDGAGGFLVRFYWDQQACAFAYLYLSKSGHHCVLLSMMDLYQEMGIEDEDDGNEEGGGASEENDSNDEEEAGESISKDDVDMVALTFEEYLAMVYFEELLEFRAKPFKGLCEYARCTYRAPTKL